MNAPMGVDYSIPWASKAAYPREKAVEQNGNDLRHHIESTLMEAVWKGATMRSIAGIAIVIVAGVLIVGAVACSSTPSSGSDSTPTPVNPTGAGMVPVPAPIDGVEVEVAESFPPQYFLMGAPRSA